MVYFQHRMDQRSVKGQCSRLRGRKVPKMESLGRFRMRTTTVLLCLYLIIQVQAQTVFNRRYDTLGQQQSETGWSVEILDDGSYAVIANGAWTDTLEYGSVIRALRIDQNGVPLDTSRVVDPGFWTFPGLANSTAKMANGGVVGGGNRVTATQAREAILFFFDPSGAFDTTYRYMVLDSATLGRQAKQALDGGFLLCGEFSTVGGADGFLIKTDANGTQEWVRTFGGPTSDFIVSVDLVGNGYYLGGRYRQTPGNYQFWVLRLDSIGDVVWDQRWGSPFNDNSAGVLTTSDGHVVVSSAYSLDAFDTGPKYLYMAKLDSANGEIIWEHRYGQQYYNGIILRVAKEIPGNRDLIATGFIHLPFSGPSMRGVLLRTTTEGDSLWMRLYAYHDAAIDSSEAIFNDVEPTPDGGFIAVGAAYGVSQNGTSYGQDVWVVKVDSMGCLEPGCHLITGMETQITNLRDALKVYPNPVASGSSVTVTLELPQTFKPHCPLQLTVVDAQGRLVRKENFTPNNSQLTLHTSALPSGIYHLHLSDNTRWISGCKLVVELQ